MYKTVLLGLTILLSGARSIAAPPDISSLDPFTWDINLTVPEELGNQKLAQLGLVDVTAAPFNADLAGIVDSTAVLQSAIDFARDHQMVCFFPEGTYLIRDTLQCRSSLYRFTPSNAGREISFYNRLKPCYLLGSTRGLARPRIILSSQSEGYGDPENPKYAVRFSVPGKKNIDLDVDNGSVGFNYGFIGIDIEIGEGNPGAVALRMRGAEGSTIQDCRIDANDGLTGLEGGSGSGGSFINVTVMGGQTGIDFRYTQPAPVLTGIRILNPRGPALICTADGPATLVGCEIVKQTLGPAIVTLADSSARPDDGRLSMIDCRIDLSGGAEAIHAGQSIYLENVYVRGAEVVVKTDEETVISSPNPNEWLCVQEAAVSRPMPVYTNRVYGPLQTMASIYIDQKKTTNSIVRSGYSDPSENLISQHVWSSGFPDFEDPLAVNVKDAPYYARGDGESDDTDALQFAINDHKIVFVPKGRYRVTRSLKLKPDTCLIGVAKHLSLIENRTPEGDFADASHPRPLIQTADDASATTRLGFIGTSTLNNQGRGAYLLRWQCGEKSIFREILLYSRTHQGHVMGEYIPPDYPDVIISGNGAGRFYNFMTDGAAKHPQGPGQRQLLIHDTRAPIRIYHSRFQHGAGDCNVEVRDASDVTFYGLKSEGQHQVLHVHGGRKFRLYSYSGNATRSGNQCLMSFENVENLRVVQIGAKMMAGAGQPGAFMGAYYDPREWSVFQDLVPGIDLPFTIPPRERPLLYQREFVRTTCSGEKIKPCGQK